jgi:hypothetical protein
VSSAAKQKTHRMVDRTMAGGNPSRASDNEDSSSSCSEGTVMAATNQSLASETEEEEDDDVLRNSPERLMALSIHQQDIHPKLHQLIDRILSELERLQSKSYFFIFLNLSFNFIH